MSDYRNQIWKALLAEFVGTFTLVFFSGSAYALTAAQGGNTVVSALATGLALTFSIYIFGRWSGAHLNPVVSFGFSLACQMNWGLMLAYWVAQLVGAIAAGALVSYMFGGGNESGATIGTLTNSNGWKAVLVEAFLTFFLVFGYLQLYRDPTQALISGVVLGGVMAAIVFAGNYLTGASTNPARSLGTAIFSNNMGTYWVYVVGPLIGAAVAVLIYKLMNLNLSSKAAKDCCGNQQYDECGNRLVVVERALVDKCGRCIKSCDGKPTTQKWLMVEPKHGFVQTTPMMAVNEMAREQGYSLEHLADEMIVPYLDKKGKVPSTFDLKTLLVKENTIPVSAAVSSNAPSASSTIARNPGLASVAAPIANTLVSGSLPTTNVLSGGSFM